MKKAGFLLALMCTLSLTGCGMMASAEEEMLQPNMEENIVSVNFDDVATQSEPTEQYCDHLARTTENMFADEDGIESADATVSYDEGTEQYSIKLSLEKFGISNTNNKSAKHRADTYRIIDAGRLSPVFFLCTC